MVLILLINKQNHSTQQQGIFPPNLCGYSKPTFTEGLAASDSEHQIIHTLNCCFNPGMLILVLKDSLRTFFKSLSWSLGVRSLSWWIRSLSLSLDHVL